MITRLPDWRPRLRAWLSEMARHPGPITPGQHDCCLFAAAALEAQTGVDLAAPWRGRYTTFRGGLRLIRKAGHADLAALLAGHLSETPVLEAQPGDIVVLASAEGPAMGVVQGAGVYCLGPDGRLSGVPTTAIMRLFQAGDR